MPAVFAFLIGIAAGDVPHWAQPLSPAVDAEPELAPVLNGTPSDRRATRIDDDETVGSLPPGATGTVTIERRIIIRIPTLRPPPVPVPSVSPKLSTASPLRQSPTCLTLRGIRGASFQGKLGIVFVTATAIRYQAVLERGCRPVDFQSGFYLSPPADGAICAGRDMLHARSGLKCTITGLTRLSSGM
ncbi:MAG TPA: hypothetical protein VF475_05665 [Sphingobium sp.]